MKKSLMMMLACAAGALPLAAQSDTALAVDREADALAIAEQLYRQARALSADPASSAQLYSRAADLFADFVRRALGYPRERVFGTGTLLDTAYHNFPQSGTVSFDGIWDENGQSSPYDPYSSGMTAGTEPYWAPLEEPASFGMAGRSEALLDARVTVSGLELLFGPMSGQDFDAAFCAPPLVEVACEGNAMTLTCRDTYLDCMALAQGEPEDLERLQQQGTLYPGSFPEGPLDGSNRFISRAEVSQEGSGVAVRLTLTEDAGQYTVSREYLGPADGGPYLRLSLRETW